MLWENTIDFLQINKQKNMKIKLKTFSKYNILDKKDFYKQIYNYLIKTKQGFCFTSIGIISREDCERIIN